MPELSFFTELILAAGAALASTGLIVGIYPLLVRYALVKPNARSSHAIPTPQGGGIAVAAATILVCGAWHFFWAPGVRLDGAIVVVISATLLMAGLGAFDDIRPLPVIPRLALQLIAIAGVIYALPSEVRVATFLSPWVERLLLVVGGLWFVNLVNFMDGVDWMTVVETVPICAGLAVAGTAGALPPFAVAIVVSLGGAMLGFAYFNRPVARLFLGDVGSLPLGLVLGWLLLLLAGSGHLVAAVLMSLYYLSDTTITLFRRLRNGEPVWQAHRSHFYQRAITNGFAVIEVVGRVFLVNICLCTLSTDRF